MFSELSSILLEDYSKAILLLLGMPSLFFSLFVVILWYKEAKKFLTIKKRDAAHWLIFGVWIGFVGYVIDTLYWDIAWTSESKAMIKFHFIVHIVFRQIIGTISAYCHIRSYAEMNKEENIIGATKILLIVSIIIGISYSVLLTYIKI